MNKQFPTTEELDEQERELARILRVLPGGEPPAELDARILKAAGNAAATSRRPRTRWIASAGALWGIGGAAAAVLALGVSWQLMYPQNRSMRPEAAPAARMEDKAEDATVSVELKDQQSGESSNAPAPSPALKSALQEPAAQAYSAAPGAPPPPPAPTTAASPESFASEHLDEHVTTSADVAASADGVAPSAAVAGRSEAVSNAAQAAPAAKAAAESRMAQRAAASEAEATGGLAMTPEPGPMKPANWFAHIRQLQSENRSAEAKASLLEFQRRYPDFVIPSDLAPLLRE